MWGEPDTTPGIVTQKAMLLLCLMISQKDASEKFRETQK